jgi:hypothetical protein
MFPEDVLFGFLHALFDPRVRIKEGRLVVHRLWRRRWIAAPGDPLEVAFEAYEHMFPSRARLRIHLTLTGRTISLDETDKGFELAVAWLSSQGWATEAAAADVLKWPGRRAQVQRA